MLVKKINPEWAPAENRGLALGATIEITNPQALILSGMVVAVDSNGEELSSYEMYGVLAGKEKEDFETYLAAQRAEKTKAKMEVENEELKAKVEEAKAEADKLKEAVKEELKKETKTTK